MDYKLSRAVAILRAAHAEMAAAKPDRRPPVLADLEILGVRTGAVVVDRPKRPGARAA